MFQPAPRPVAALPLRSLLFALGCVLAPAYGASGQSAGAASAQSDGASIEHIIVSYDPARFHGWPANEGMWIWGDEILIGYNTGPYVFRDTKHSIDPNATMQLTFSRSMDGGRTWQEESQYPAIGFSRPRRTPPANTDAVDFLSDTSAVKMRYRNFHTSDDRGKTWQGPFSLPFADMGITARTSYVATGPQSALLFLTSQPADLSVREGRCFVAETTDGGKTFEFLSWIGDESTSVDAGGNTVHSIMPNAIRLEDGRILCVLRQRIDRRKWTDIFESADDGKSWQHLGVLERGSSNPVSLVQLPDGRVAAVYGWRGRNLGLRGKVSADGGKSWSEEVVLRDDASSWDIGYVQAKARSDGTVVIVYYYATKERPEQHIAGTLWKP